MREISRLESVPQTLRIIDAKTATTVQMLLLLLLLLRVISIPSSFKAELDKRGSTIKTFHCVIFCLMSAL